MCPVSTLDGVSLYTVVSVVSVITEIQEIARCRFPPLSKNSYCIGAKWARGGHQSQCCANPRPAVPFRETTSRRRDRKHVGGCAIQRKHEPTRAAGLGNSAGGASTGRPAGPFRVNQRCLGD